MIISDSHATIPSPQWMSIEEGTFQLLMKPDTCSIVGSGFKQAMCPLADYVFLLLHSLPEARLLQQLAEI